MLELKQSIVVEGKGDAANIAGVCRANFILTSGIHISKKTYEEIALAIEKTGIILFTDPDSAGREIRKKILRRFSDRSERILHANISAKEGRKKGDLGVENASGEAILSALRALRPAFECEAPLLLPGSEGAPCTSGVGALSSEAPGNLLESSEKRKQSIVYTMEEMRKLGLAGSEFAMCRREAICDALRIGYCNAKQLAKKLSAYGIGYEEVFELLNGIEKNELL